MLDIFNPLHNIKEICKEFVLLEDHLQAPEKRCPDCIRKHLLKAEAFAEEAIALDKKGEHLKLCRPLPGEIRKIQEAFMKGEDDHQLGQRVRKVRKRLTPLCFKMNLKTRKKKGHHKSPPIELVIAKGVWPGTTNSKDFKYLLLGIRKAKNTSGIPFLFKEPGVSLSVRKNPKWIANKAKERFEKGQIGRMISQTLHSGLKYQPQDWFAAVRADLCGGQRIALETPFSSIGEMLSDKRIERKAYKNAIKQGYGQTLKSINMMMQQVHKDPNMQLRIAKIYRHLGNKSGEIYFIVKAASIFDKLKETQLEADAFQDVLNIQPNHPLKFWLGNKVEMAARIAPIKRKKGGQPSKKEDTRIGSLSSALGIVAFGAGVGLGFL